jgi:hypothetical protein
MATYLKGNSRKIVRQEGDDADVTITIPEMLPVVGATLKFAVFKQWQKVPFINKSVVMATQAVTIPLVPDDTKGHPGLHFYEIEIVKPDGKILTAATNQFEILKELIQ